MTYKETLLFIGKCLTLDHDKENKILVEERLQANSIDWDNVVRLSTAHYVLPALFCNFSRSGYLKYLPKDLKEYMEHITDLNRSRNEQIIKQANELNELLLNNGITPVFLKGTGNLILGLYQDIGERMIGDIDIIISPNDFKKAVLVLKQFGYYTTKENIWKSHRHYPELIIKDGISAIEVHKELLREKYTKKFNYSHICKDIQKNNNYNFLSYSNQFLLTIFSHQINDFGHLKKAINLRTIYDAFILSKKTKITTNIINNKSLKKVVFDFIIISEAILSSNLQLENIIINKRLSRKIEKNISPKKGFIYYRNKYLVLAFNKKNTIKEFFLNRNYRVYILKKYKLS
jgi:hypothetical protein